MALISLKHVSKIYPRASRPALDDISLTISRGEFVFLVGASGAGKSTLLSLLLREEEATDGDIRVAGNDLRRMPDRHVPRYRRTIGFVFQDYKLLPNRTVYQNVAFALEVIGTKRSTIRTLVPQVLEAVGLKGKEDRLPHELSGGEVQRVAIARAYVNHPQIILADEPTGNLDPTTSVGIMEVLDAINRTGTTVVMATHNEEIVNSMRRRVVELHTGEIVRDERKGGYDSSVYFPDKETEAQASSGQNSEGRDDKPAGSTDRAADKGYKEGSVPAGDEAEDGGLKRLANSVHSGRTGRYADTFQSAEDTLTWGKGLLPENSGSPDQPDNPGHDTHEEGGN
ncbi:cell division ATP-binding protein FtsE [Scardovia wiggsiae]